MRRYVHYILIVQILFLISITYVLAFEKKVDIFRIENFIRNSYLRPDKKYEAIPVNRFRELVVISQISLRILENQEDISSEIIFLKNGLFRVRILKNGTISTEKIDPLNQLNFRSIDFKDILTQLPLPESLREGAYFTNLFETKYGIFLFYRVSQLGIRSDELSVDDLTDKERTFVEGFVLASNKAILGPRFKVQKVDPEKGYSMELWDVFNFQNQLFVLIFRRVYESHEFEVYSLKENEIKLVKSFQFGGL